MKKEGKILIVDDDRRILDSSVQLLKHDFSEIIALPNPIQLPEVLAKNEFDVILLDMNFSATVNTGNEGLFWLGKILEVDPLAIIIMITAYGDIDLAVNAIKEGASFFIQKPWEPEKLIATIKTGIKFRQTNLEVNKLKRKQKYLIKESASGSATILGNSKAISDCLATIQKVSATDANVLLVGENGTGKELLAREIHRQSLRKDEIFVSVDMGSVSATLFESELFGHKKGAFTDAREDRVGRIELASGGTLFLDEIGNLPILLQSKILTCLEQRLVTPVGSNENIEVDIRIISATNMNLRSMVADNFFREDLLYRLNTIEIIIPPLRDRGEDIILLTNCFLERFSKQYQKEGIRITEKAYDRIMTHKWPGNIRELKHSVERAVILADSAMLKPADFFNPGTLEEGKETGPLLSLAVVEKDLIQRALNHHGMNISKAAKVLDISRSTLYSKMKKYDL
ncbi:MAG TPA: sigma-54 dependent transcriptional regulator [Bacteroidales bacterium]|nr:sigma-54 dependent transcriptional regulator [Bacteroidales bacterium]